MIIQIQVIDNCYNHFKVNEKTTESECDRFSEVFIPGAGVPKLGPATANCLLLLLIL